MTKKEEKKHEIAIKIAKLLIDSELSVSDQLKVINNVREKLMFCRSTGLEMQQTELF